MTDKPLFTISYTNVEDYIDGLPQNITRLDLSNKNLKSIPSLERFEKLEFVMFSNNVYLQSLPPMPQSVDTVYCENTDIDTLPLYLVNLRIIKYKHCSKLPVEILKHEFTCYDYDGNSFPRYEFANNRTHVNELRQIANIFEQKQVQVIQENALALRQITDPLVLIKQLNTLIEEKMPKKPHRQIIIANLSKILNSLYYKTDLEYDEKFIYQSYTTNDNDNTNDVTYNNAFPSPSPPHPH